MSCTRYCCISCMSACCHHLYYTPNISLPLSFSLSIPKHNVTVDRTANPPRVSRTVKPLVLRSVSSPIPICLRFTCVTISDRASSPSCVYSRHYSEFDIGVLSTNICVTLDVGRHPRHIRFRSFLFTAERSGSADGRAVCGSPVRRSLLFCNLSSFPVPVCLRFLCVTTEDRIDSQSSIYPERYSDNLFNSDADVHRAIPAYSAR